MVFLLVRQPNNNRYTRLPANNYTALMNAVATVGPIAISAAAEPWQLYVVVI